MHIHVVSSDLDKARERLVGQAVDAVLAPIGPGWNWGSAWGAVVLDAAWESFGPELPQMIHQLPDGADCWVQVDLWKVYFARMLLRRDYGTQPLRDVVLSMLQEAERTAQQTVCLLVSDEIRRDGEDPLAETALGVLGFMRTMPQTIDEITLLTRDHLSKHRLAQLWREAAASLPR